LLLKNKNLTTFKAKEDIQLLLRIPLSYLYYMFIAITLLPLF